MDDQLSNRIFKFLRSGGNARANGSVGDYAVNTTVGLVRDQNQDAALIVKARYGSGADRDFDLAIVCDGLGGMKHGAEASALALSAFVSRVVRFSRVPMEGRVLGGMIDANERLFQAYRGEGGTTLSAVALTRSEPAMICHVGDSRVYAIGNQSVRQLTHDDTLQAALQKKPDSGGQRDTRLLQFVGMGADLEAQLFKAPNLNITGYLLTSDGAHDIPQPFLQRVVHAARNNSDLARKLVQLSEILGGFDNATAVVLPSSLTEETERPSEGLDLQLMAPSGQLSIWIPQLSDERRGAPPSGGALPELSESDQDHVNSEVPKNEQNKGVKTKRVRTKSGKKRKRTRGAEELPLVDPLTIQFPPSDEN